MILHVSLDTTHLGSVSGTVRFPSGGTSYGWELPADLYHDHWELASALQDAIRTATSDSNWTVTLLSNGSEGYQVQYGTGINNFDITFPGVLRSHCGFSSGYVGAYTVTSDTPLGWWPLLPVDDPDIYYVHRRVTDVGDSEHTPIIIYRGTVERFTGSLQYTREDVEQLRTCLGPMIQGRQFRVFLDSYTTYGWAEDERAGLLDLILSSDSYAEAWANEPAATIGSMPLDAIRVNY